MAARRPADAVTTEAAVQEAVAVQEKLRGLVEVADVGTTPQYVAGLDVAYDGDRLAAAVVLLDATTLEEVDRAVVRGETAFPYIPGLFAFREVPALLSALAELTIRPGLLVCDGQGLAHPRRFGLACHLGVLTGIPAIGVAKTAYVGTHGALGIARGATAELVDGDDVVGAAVRTQDGVKPVYVSVGHRVTLATAVAQVLRLAPAYRLPETTRLADRACREGLRDG